MKEQQRKERRAPADHRRRDHGRARGRRRRRHLASEPPRQDQQQHCRPTASTGWSIGPDDAPTKVVIYEDFLCPACGYFESITQREAGRGRGRPARCQSRVPRRSTSCRTQTSRTTPLRAANAFRAVWVAGRSRGRQGVPRRDLQPTSPRSRARSPTTTGSSRRPSPPAPTRPRSGRRSRTWSTRTGSTPPPRTPPESEATPTVYVDGEIVEAGSLDEMADDRPQRHWLIPDGAGRLHRRPAQGRAARPPRGLGVRADRRRARGPPSRDRAGRPRGAARFFEFRDFAHFIEVYLAVVALVRTPEDVRLLTYEVAREMATEQQIRYAELTCTPYTSRAARTTPTGACRSRPTPRRSRTPGSPPSGTSAWCCAGSTTSPGSSGCPPPTPRSGSRWTTGSTPWSASAWAAPRSACPGRSSSRTSTPPAPPDCTACPHAGRDHRPRDGLGRGSAARRRADRPRHHRRPGPGLLAHLAQAQIPLEVCPSSNVATRAVRVARPSTRCAPSSPRACRSRSTPTTRRCSAPRSTGSTPWPPTCSTSTPLGLAELARAAVRASFAEDDVRRRLLAEIDDYVAR